MGTKVLLSSGRRLIYSGDIQGYDREKMAKKLPDGSLVDEYVCLELRGHFDAIGYRQYEKKNGRLATTTSDRSMKLPKILIELIAHA